MEVGKIEWIKEKAKQRERNKGEIEGRKIE
jgi:hypothetical protein